MKIIIFLTILSLVVATTPLKSNADDLGRPPTGMPCIIGNCKNDHHGVTCQNVPDAQYVYGIHCVNPPPGYYCMQDSKQIHCSCFFPYSGNEGCKGYG